MSNHEHEKVLSQVNRRDFVKAVAATGATLALSKVALGDEVPAAPKPAADDLNIAVVGCGVQGRVLIESCLRIPGVRFQAVCDIWEYNQQYAQRSLKKYGYAVNAYDDYRELLAKEKGLTAVICAAPDWMHAEITNAALESGHHVYCEKEMSNSLEMAKSMVLTARKTGKLLQIGHQRRSNPRYLHAVEKLIHEIKLIGRVTHSYAQWNRAVQDEIGWAKKYEMDAAKLAKYGYNSMREFMNWRWFKKYGGGPIVDLGSHQIDLFSWVFGANPSSIIASGGVDYYKGREWFDNVMVIYEYETPHGMSRAYYQVLTTTKRGGFYEAFMGVEGSMTISEVPAVGNTVERETTAPPWDEWIKKGYLKNVKEPIRATSTKNVMIDVRVTQESGKYPLPIELAKPAHQPHLENFFETIRGRAKLTCPAEVGYETCVAVLKANEAVNSGCKLKFKPEDFVV